MRLTQPVLLQSFKDEFELPDEETPATPAVPGSVLIDGEIDTNQKELSSYRTGVGKFLHMARWTRPEILNAVRELSRFMSKATQKHLTAMKRAMHYCVSTPQRGLLLKPDTEWDGNQDFEFIVKGRSDSDYAKDPRYETKCQRIFDILMRSTHNNEKQDAELCDFVRYRSRASQRNNLCTRHVVCHESTGVHWSKGEEADDSTG